MRTRSSQCLVMKSQSSRPLTNSADRRRLSTGEAVALLVADVSQPGAHWVSSRS